MTLEPTNDWEISDLQLLDDEEFIETVQGFTNAEDLDFDGQVSLVADRLFNIHSERNVNGEFVFGFETDAERMSLNGATVAIDIPERPNTYLMEHLPMSDLTTDPHATGEDAALAIKHRLMDSYARLRAVAVAAALLIEDSPADVS